MRPLLAIACALPLAGCIDFDHSNRDVVQQPDIAVGTGATIIYPGQSAPAASRGSGQPGAAGAETQGGDITMIGGAAQEASGSQQTRKVPIIGPITALFGYPFWIFGKSLEEKARDEAAEERGGASPPPSPDEQERQRLHEENQRLQRELQGAPPTPPSATPVEAGSGASAIARELAALERSLGVPGRGAAPEPPPLRDGSFREARDRDGDGRVDRWVIYDEAERVRRTEEDSDGDGRIDAITLYEAGQVSRKRMDADGDGATDSWSFYRDGELVRHEVDRDRDGFRDLVLIYAGGELLREEEDRNGDGRPDVVVLYRDGDVLQRDEDLDFDGTPDVRSFYEHGALVRREVRSEELLERAQTRPAP